MYIISASSSFHLPHTTGVTKTAMMVRSVAAHSPQLGHKLVTRLWKITESSDEQNYSPYNVINLLYEYYTIQ
jgi:hypothetical protein